MLLKLLIKSQIIIFFFLILSSLEVLAAELPSTAGRIAVIDKAKKTLTLFKNGSPVAQFPASFGIDPDSDKYKIRDGATPEGLYFISYKKHESHFHRFLGISYPNLANAARGLAYGAISLKEYKRIYQASSRTTGRIPCGTGLGCGIGIHGGGVFRESGKTKERDWTEGCIALNNPDVEKVFDFCRIGDPVVIFNSRRNPCGIIRPFTYPKDIGENGAPVCTDGICTYQTEINTFLGRMILTVAEGKEYGRSFSVMVYKDDSRERPLLVLFDHNADGFISLLDSVSGPMAEGALPDALYTRVREAIIDALSRGDIFVSGRGR